MSCRLMKEVLARSVAPSSKFGDTRALLRQFAKEKDCLERKQLLGQIRIFFCAAALTARSDIRCLRNPECAKNPQDALARSQVADLLERRYASVSKSLPWSARK